MTAWTTASDIRAKLQRRWDDGTILRAVASDAPFPVVDVPVRGPQPADIGDDLGKVRAWIVGLEAGSRNGARYTLRYVTIGGRLIGRNDMPDRAIIDSYDQAAALLSTGEQLHTYKAVLAAVEPEPVVLAWAAANPLRALEVADLWPALLSAYRWLDAARGSGRYLREITAPGADTKFVERHRPLLAQLLGVPSAGPGFLAGLGLAAKPGTVRLRPGPATRLTAGLSDVTARLDELAKLDLAVARALVIENEITFLSVPVPSDGVVVWGKGFEVDRVGALPWLAGAEVVYWGDLDTHGFAILNQLRAWLPQTRSVLMDRGTLLAHRERWVAEPSPTAARLDRLTGEEQALYQDLVTDRLGERVRLEQERISWNWVTDQLPY
jgi:hypothetical protein